MHFSDEHVWTRLVVDVVVKVVDDVVVIVVEVVEVVVVYTLYDTSSFDGWDYLSNCFVKYGNFTSILMAKYKVFFVSCLFIYT